MKKLLLLATTCLAIIACSKDNAEEHFPEQRSNVTFSLAMVNKAENDIKTKNRPLYSQEAIQEVENVNIYVFREDGSAYTYLKTFNVENWIKGATSRNYTIADTMELPTGSYKFLAIGQENDDNFTLTSPVIGATSAEDIIASITTPGNEHEIFAGIDSVSISSEGARVNIELTRKVAGVLGYFQNIPKKIDNNNVKYLRLSITNANRAVNLSSSIGSDSITGEYHILDIDLSSQDNNNDIFAGNDLSGTGVVKVVNSQLNGKFMIPVTDIQMKVRLCDSSYGILKEWSVLDNGSAIFSIDANHFYSLGKKVVAADTTGGGTPGTDDDDAPIDLLKDQAINIIINPNWIDIHDLTIQ